MRAAKLTTEIWRLDQDVGRHAELATAVDGADRLSGGDTCELDAWPGRATSRIRSLGSPGAAIERDVELTEGRVNEVVLRLDVP